MKKTTIDSTLLPNVWLSWSTNSGNYWLECSTGKKTNEKPNITFSYSNRMDICIRANSHPYFAYVKYHKDIEMLEVAVATINTSRKEIARSWEYASDKYFIDKAKNIYDENGNTLDTNGRFKLYDYYTSYGFKNFLGALCRLYYSPKTIENFKEFIGNDYYTIGNGRNVKIEWVWNIRDWYVKKQGKNTKGKAQILTDKLTAIALSDISDFNDKYPIKTQVKKSGYKYNVRNIMFFERVNNEWSVLRMIDRMHDGNIYETERMYINDNGTNRIVSPNNNTTWIPSKQTIDYSYYNFVNKNEAMEKCNRLKYIIPLFDDEMYIKDNLMKALQFPEIEQMIKLGCKNVAMKLAHSSTTKADMKHIFGGYYNEKETTLLRKAGLTKHQFDKCNFDARNWYTQGVIRELRELFGDELIHIDNNTFDKYYDAFSLINKQTSWGGGIRSYSEMFNLDYKKLIKNLIRLAEKHESVYQIINDTMNMYSRLNRGTAPEIDWYFDSFSDLTRAHDVINALKLEQDAERRAMWNMAEAERRAMWNMAEAERRAMWNMAEAERRKKEEARRKKLDEERKEFEYEDDKYIIRLPLDGNEIINEGSKQRICIGSYVSSHSNGNTNLFFIRQKECPDIPFYAIQMDNNKNIVQIHGYCNKWLGNNPEAIPTVIRWLRKNNIKCSDNILTCTSTGYGSCNHYVKMPVVD